MKRACRPGLNSSTDPLVPVARIGRPHGVRGEVTVRVIPDGPGEFQPGVVFQLADGGSLALRAAAPYRDRGYILAFEGIGDRTAAERLRGLVLHVHPDDRRSLDDDEFWSDDLVGLTAVNPDGAVLGRVSGIDLGDAQDRLVVTTPAGTEVLVPFVDPIVGEVGEDTVVVDPPEGLFE
ncbi:MAG TPA: ribosome maturation factor RimM [Acidimicrobiia bacterium]|nr:ribosome maturation factor RimM [Acidimicrobiia bacterium]